MRASGVVAFEPGLLATCLGVAFFAALPFPVPLFELPGGMSPGQLLMLGSLPVWFVTSLRRDGIPLDPTAMFAAVAILLCSALLILCSLVTAFTVDVPFRAARQVVSLLTAVALFTLVVGTATRFRLWLYGSALCFPMALTCLIAVTGYVSPTVYDLIFQDKDRAYGFFKNPNQFGIAITTVLPVAVAMAFATRRNVWLHVACVLLLLLGLVACGSKTNLLIAAMMLPLCLVLFGFITYSGAQRVLAIAATLFGCVTAGVLFVVVLSMLNPRALSILGEFVMQGEATGSVESRSIVWRDSIALLLDHPYLGVGAGESIDGLSHSHNVILDYARTLGVPGLVLIAAMLITVLVVCTSSVLLAVFERSGRLADRYLCIGFALGTISYVGANMSSDSLGPTTSCFFFSVLFLGLASRRLCISSPRSGSFRVAVAPFATG